MKAPKKIYYDPYINAAISNPERHRGMPEVGENVLVKRINGKYAIAHISNSGSWYDKDHPIEYEVTHWQPLTTKRMNYKEIKSTCPKAVRELELWLNAEILSNGSIKHNGQKRYTERILFDFFDSVGVYVEIYRTYPADGQLKWSPKVGDETLWTHSNSRPEAESAAFTKAFEILEEQQK